MLYRLVQHHYEELRTRIYRKLTHSGRLLDVSSYNLASYNVTAIKTLKSGAQLFCDSPDALRNQAQHLLRQRTERNHQFDCWYRYDRLQVRLLTLLTMLRLLLTNVEDKEHPRDRQCARIFRVYEATNMYAGENGRNAKTRLIKCKWQLRTVGERTTLLNIADKVTITFTGARQNI